jgi:circadian clock protein KaiC
MKSMASMAVADARKAFAAQPSLMRAKWLWRLAGGGSAQALYGTQMTSLALKTAKASLEFQVIEQKDKAGLGVLGLDDITRGGLARGRLYLLEGSPGTGKTTVATQFLRAGAAAGERCLYITLSETEDELRAGAASHGWDLEGIELFELVPPESLLDDDQQQSLLYSSDLELGETTRRIFEAFEQNKPQRVVLDSLSEIRLLAQSSLRYRRQILALKHYFARSGATVLMLDDLSSEANDRTMHSVAHGVFRLEELSPEYGPERRRMRVVKYRGQHYRGGYHDFVIATGGVKVFPRLVSAEHRTEFKREVLATDSPELNALLGGGLERGSSVLILGPAGTGKSLLALTFVAGSVKRGEKAAMFVFDEELGLLFERAKGLGIDIQAMVDGGKLVIEQIDAAEMTPGELSALVRRCVEDNGAKTVVIDSLNGYQAAMPEEQALILHMHELLQYLNRQGVSTFLTVAQHGLVGDMKAPVDVTYLADTVILLRYFEALGRVRRAMSVIKKRTGAHEDTIREYQIDRRGISLGEPLIAFQGVLRGVPELVGETDSLLEPQH